MLLVLAIVYAFHITTEAAPTDRAPILSNIHALSSDISTSVIFQCICPSQQRSIWEIIWSCLATIFACSWLSVHPNMPPPREKWWKIGLRRLQLMFWALICPELIMFWAMRQWSGARQLVSQYKEQGWTKTHGYFIQMGGFTLYKGKESQGALSPEKMQDLLNRGMIQFPTISEEEIQDRSKSDGISKAIAVGQTTWFISQCIGRHAQRLDITQLELVTVALTLLNAMIYYLWWNKPFDVRCSVPIILLDKPSNANDRYKFADSTSEKWVFLALLKQTPSLVCCKVIAIATSCNTAASAFWRLITDKDYPKDVGKAIIASPAWLIMAIFDAMNRMAGEADIIHDGNASVPVFYALNISKLDHLLFAFLIIGTLFGGIHCAGWTFQFPSRGELILWRVCSALITGTPLSMLVTIIGQNLAHRTELRPFNKVLDAMARIVGIPTFALLPFYVVAQLFMLIEALVSLRDLSPGAFDVVVWTAFTPHI